MRLSIALLLLFAGLASAQTTSVKIVDPADQTKQAGVTNSGGVRALNVYCVGGTCSGGGPGGGGWTPDGGYIGTVGQGMSADGGVPWAVDTELPSATTLADATANPSTTSAGAFAHLFNGTTWDRMRGDTANGLLVNVSDSFLLDATFTGRFSAAAAAADNFANPTTTGTLGFGMLWDGATWDRQPGNSADGTLVNLGANNDVTVTGTVAVTQSGSWSLAANQSVNLAQVGGTNAVTGGVAGSQGVGGLAASGAAKSGNPVQVGGVFNTTQPTVTTGQAVEQQMTARGATIVATGVDTFTATVTQGTAANLRAQTASESSTAAAIPAVASAVGMSDGTNLQIPRLYDFDSSGGGTLWGVVTGIGGSNFGSVNIANVESVVPTAGATGVYVWDIPKDVFNPVTTAVSCASTATAAPASILTNRKTLTMMNNSTVTIYLGGSAVTTSTGIPLLPGASFMDDVSNSTYYCIVASGTADLRVLEN